MSRKVLPGCYFVGATTMMCWLPSIALAAGFDCAKAGSPVEKAVCASPNLSALDGRLTDAFRKALVAMPEQADAIKLDQRHWLAQRDDTAWSFISSGLAKNVDASLSTLYSARIDFLNGLGKPVPAPLNVVQASLGKLPAHSGDVLADLARQGAPIELAASVPVDAKRPFPLRPDADLQHWIGDNGSEGLSYYELKASPIGSLFSIGGTAACISEAPYRIDGQRASRVADPPVWGNDCMVSHAIARLGRDVVALRIDGAASDTVMLASSTWTDGRFAPAQALALRFDRALALVGSACAPTQSPCADFGKAAMDAATRYDRRPLAGTLDRALTGKDKATYEALLAAARSPQSGLAQDSSGGHSTELPTFGARLGGSGMDGYSTEATFFPITFRGEALIGCIGHGHVGWRTNGDWLVSAWRLKGSALEPVASAYVEVKRGAWLLAASVPAPSPERH